MTPKEQLAFFEDLARLTADAAMSHRRAGNSIGALHNWSQAAKNHFMRALIGQRAGLLDPRPDLRLSMDLSEKAASFIAEPGVAPLRTLFDPVPGAYSALILREPGAAAIGLLSQNAVWPPPKGTTPDMPLEAWLARGLLGETCRPGRDRAVLLGRLKRLRLLSQTFVAYFDLSAVASEAEASELTRIALELFSQRRRDDYYSGGVDYQGGGMENDIVIDFHLAAIWRVRGWDLSTLPPDVRQHVALPG